METPTWPTRRAISVRDESGLGLTELLIAMFILAVAIMGLASVVLNSLVSTRESRNRQLATDAVSSAIETLRASPWADLSMDATELEADDPWLTTVDGQPAIDHDGAGGDAPEKVIVTGAFPYSPYVYAQGPVTVRRYVTWVGDPAAETAAKRVTVIATWESAGRERTVRESTIIANALRGLAAPDFQLTPELLEATVPPGTTAGPTTACVTHDLINLGERDRHDFNIANLDLDGDGAKDGDGNWSALGTYLWGTGFPADGKWAARAYVGIDQMVDANADNLPDSVEFVPRGETRVLKICYDVPKQVEAGDVFTWYVIVRSSFDPSVQQIVTHRLTIGVPAAGSQGLLLRSDVGVSGDARQFTMTELADSEVLPGVLSDYDGDGVPGWRLVAGGNDRSNLTRWEWQHADEAALPIGPTADLTLYTAWDRAVTESSNDPVRLVYDVTVVHWDISQRGANRRVVLGTTSLDYTHDKSGWLAQSASISIPATTMDKSDYLFLEVRCSALSEADCHLGFDANPGPASAVVSALDMDGVTR